MQGSECKAPPKCLPWLLQIALGRDEASVDYDTAQEAAVHQIAADAGAHCTNSEIAKAEADSDSNIALLHNSHVIQVRPVCESAKALP